MMESAEDVVLTICVFAVMGIFVVNRAIAHWRDR